MQPTANTYSQWSFLINFLEIRNYNSHIFNLSVLEVN